LPHHLLTTTAIDILFKILIHKTQAQIGHLSINEEYKDKCLDEYVRGIDGFVATLIMN
jgi:hypothetical protein